MRVVKFILDIFSSPIFYSIVVFIVAINFVRERKAGKFIDMSPKKIVFCIISSLLLSACIIMIIVLTVFNKKSDDTWYYSEMNIDKLWQYSIGDGQTIAFIDTGISDSMLEANRDKIKHTYNVITNSDNVSDKNGHGTEMISVACTGYNETTSGIAYGADMIIVKAVNDNGTTNNTYLLRAINYAVENGATVINISLGGFKSDDAVIEAINAAINKGITVVSAAGDYGNKDLLFPANVDGVISVGGLERDLSIWKNSNKSSDCTCYFPAVDISAISLRDREYKENTILGTSASCALASGYIALIREFAELNSIPLNNDQLVGVLKNIKVQGKDEFNFGEPFEQLNTKK